MPPKRKQNPRTADKPGPGRPKKTKTATTNDGGLHVPSQAMKSTFSKPPAPTHPFAPNELLKSLLPRSGFDYSMFHLVHPEGINHENYLAMDPEHADWLITALFKNSGVNPYAYGYDYQNQVGTRSHLHLVVETGLTTLFNALHDVVSELDLTECKLVGNDTDKAGAGYLSPFWEQVVADTKYSGAWFHVGGSHRQQVGHQAQDKPVVLGGQKWKVPISWTGYLRTKPPMTRARGREATVPYLCSISRPNPEQMYCIPSPEQVHYFPSGAPPGPGYKPLITMSNTPDPCSPSTSEGLHKAFLALHSLMALILDAREYVIERPGRFPSRNLPSNDPLILAIDHFRDYLEAAFDPSDEPVQGAFYSYHATLFRLELPVAAGLFGGSSDVEEDEDDEDDEDERLSDTESDYACSSYAGSVSAKKFWR
ncbi:hypothetical protein SMACR_04928 [Sordaria macrospora]|uniref:WGS project CABT00000000 data, contig 2.1 n=2 Tax=Sordaria macrospora TaxID=5147 RepID=F7VM07_SORMK|nr:uncharacterized protein SMAC_04928 [Sordaria macrospora k-hell]KAA8630507.1 hypothetical protein SMACR_04928 [Sordaria macrospora]KAH7628313.1 hypothetical protein B0T09DRAFT_367719 [Sordaria sp. MPI-SDFR-AT-0083]CCC06535.1 unnamed protein product [Sordaria macrospora k-hell]